MAGKKSFRLPYAGRPEIWAYLFVAMVCASVLGITAWRAVVARDLAIEDARTAAANLARSLADQARSTVGSADQITEDLADWLESGGTGPNALRRLSLRMATLVGEHPGLRSIKIYGPDGVAVATSHLRALAAESVADQPTFQAHRESQDRSARVYGPFRRTENGRLALAVSRRFVDADHNFAGIVRATIDLDAIGLFYSEFDNGPNGYIALVGNDGTIMVRVPELPGLAGTSVAGSRLFQEARRTGGFGNFLQRSTFDGVKRLVNYRAVQDYPLMVFVARANVDVLDGWFQDTFVSGAVALTVAGALGLFGWRLGRYIRLHRKAEGDVRASERHYRLLADHGSDLVTVLGPDGRRTYVSPASVRLLGYQPEEMLNKHPMEMAHPDDHEALAAHFAAGFRDGNAPPVTFRAQHKDGRWVWLEAVARQMAEGGQVASLRDVGQRKAAEDLLQEANQRLRMMVMQDGLTGIANRRCFDEMLEQEHRRAARESVPLALLLIDVDRFKAFNDTYGHMAGDACLRRIAAELHTHARRPADLVARYGGEEFAFLLPGTDGAGAFARAETMRLAIRDLAIAHGCSSVGVVTISIGVGVIWPQPGQDLAPTLIDVADTALYRAKAAGRNRVEAGFEFSGVPTSQELFAEVGAGLSTAPH